MIYLYISSYNIEDLNYKQFKVCFYRFLLSCVCSFGNFRDKKESYFIEEYIIPQLVTQMLKNTGRVDGICYYSTIYIPEEDEKAFTDKEYVIQCGKASCKSSELKKYMNVDESSLNLILFTHRENTESAIDEKLRNNFEISMPISINSMKKNAVEFKGGYEGEKSPTYEEKIHILEDFVNFQEYLADSIEYTTDSRVLKEQLESMLKGG